MFIFKYWVVECKVFQYQLNPYYSKCENLNYFKAKITQIEKWASEKKFMVRQCLISLIWNIDQDDIGKFHKKVDGSLMTK